MSEKIISKIDIRKFDLEALENYFLEMGEKKFRAKQVYEWLWKKGARVFGEMSNLSKDLRESLEENFVINVIQEDKVQRSADGTIKSRLPCQIVTGILILSGLNPQSSQNNKLSSI